MKRKYIFIILITILFLVSCSGITSDPPNYLIGLYREVTDEDFCKRKIEFTNKYEVIINDNIKGTYLMQFTKVRQEASGIIHNGTLTLNINGYNIKLHSSHTIIELQRNQIESKLILKLNDSNNEVAKQFFKKNITIDSKNSVTLKQQPEREFK